MFTALILILLAAGSSETVEVAPGEMLTVVTEGNGPTVVLVPGLSGCAYSYRKIVPGIVAAGYRVVIVEPLGVGASGRPRGADYTLTAQADRLAAAVEKLGGEPVLVVAHGVAGSMALRLASRRPELVAGLLSIEGGPVESALTPAVKKSLSLAKVVGKLGGGRAIRDRFGKGLEDSSGDPSWLDKRTLRRYYAGFGRDVQASLDALIAMAESREPELLQPNLHRIACPVLMLLGSAEHRGAPSAADIELLTARVPDFATRTVAGAGHYIFEEDPPAVVAAILDLADRCLRNPGGERTLAATENEGGSSCARW
jgi:pimeloyl-ACP methyl ester carboxylesterase